MFFSYGVIENCQNCATVIRITRLGADHIPYENILRVGWHAGSRTRLREGYAVMSLRYDWPPKRGTSVGLAIGTPASRESELLRLPELVVHPSA